MNQPVSLKPFSPVPEKEEDISNNNYMKMKLRDKFKEVR